MTTNNNQSNQSEARSFVATAHSGSAISTGHNSTRHHYMASQCEIDEAEREYMMGMDSDYTPILTGDDAKRVAESPANKCIYHANGSIYSGKLRAESDGMSLIKQDPVTGSHLLHIYHTNADGQSSVKKLKFNKRIGATKVNGKWVGGKKVPPTDLGTTTWQSVFIKSTAETADPFSMSELSTEDFPSLAQAKTMKPVSAWGRGAPQIQADKTVVVDPSTTKFTTVDRRPTKVRPTNVRPTRIEYDDRSKALLKNKLSVMHGLLLDGKMYMGSQPFDATKCRLRKGQSLTTSVTHRTKYNGKKGTMTYVFNRSVYMTFFKTSDMDRRVSISKPERIDGTRKMATKFGHPIIAERCDQKSITGAESQ